MIKHLTLIALSCSFFTAVAYSQNLSDTPGLFIEREINKTNSTLTLFKARYQQCVTLKQQNIKLKNEQPSFWKTASLSYSPEYVKNITVLPSSEPPWEKEKVGLDREREYFLGNYYILISESFNYELSKDGLCQLIKTKEERRIIDDGKTITRSFRKTSARVINPSEPYDNPWMNNVPFNKSRVKKSTSPVINNTDSTKALSTISKDQSLSEKLAALKLLNNKQSVPTKNTGKANNKQSLADSMKAIQEAFSLSVEKAGNTNNSNANSSHSAAGQGCDWVKPDKISSNVCYWSISHTYPSALRRPIILKKNYNDVNEEATIFQFIESLPSSVTQIPN